VSLLAVAVAVEQERVLRQTKVAPTGVVVAVAAQVLMAVVEAVEAVRAVPDQVPLAVQGVPVVKVIRAVRAVGEVRQVVAVTPLVVQTHALVVPAVVLASISLAIRL
jgi:putative heme iron utilization protein